MLEKINCDDAGYDILFVDPTYKGNYSSRLSHSCVPNCDTVTMVASGNYTIGMFANREISYGEELTFDYCCVTDVEKEMKRALCLCGNSRCKGYYIGYFRKHIQSKPPLTSLWRANPELQGNCHRYLQRVLPQNER
jgi:hypothetical protein